MNDEKEWWDALREAATYAMPPEMRRLYSSMLLFGNVTNPRELWDAFEADMFDRRNEGQVDLQRTRALHHLGSILKMNGATLEEFGLQSVDQGLLSLIQVRFVSLISHV